MVGNTMNCKATDQITKADRQAKAGILNFITENSGSYYEVDIQMAFPNYSAEYLRKLFRQLEADGKISNNDGYSPYRVV
jgi:hypothetical protein